MVNKSLHTRRPVRRQIRGYPSTESLRPVEIGGGHGVYGKDLQNIVGREAKSNVPPGTKGDTLCDDVMTGPLCFWQQNTRYPFV